MSDPGLPRPIAELSAPNGKTGKEAIRALKRHLIRTLYRLLNTVANRTAIAINSAPNAPCIT